MLQALFFDIFDFRYAVTLKTGLRADWRVRQGHWWHHSIEGILLPIDVL